MSRALVHHPAQHPCVTVGISRRASHTGDTELTTATLTVIVGARNLAPGVTAVHLDSPALLRVFERGFHFVFRM